MFFNILIFCLKGYSQTLKSNKFNKPTTINDEFDNFIFDKRNFDNCILCIFIKRCFMSVILLSVH